MRVFEIPEGTKASKGRAVQNLINIEPDDRVLAYINVPDLTDQEFIENNFIMMCTKKGTVKKTNLEAYSRPRSNGIIAINIKDGDELMEAKLTNGESEVLMALKSGRAIRFNENTVRSMGRGASGVRGVRLANDKDEVVGMVCVQDAETTILVVSEKGYGKRTALEDYRVTNRGGKGVKTMNISDKTGELTTIKAVTDDNDLMIINKNGIAIRLEVAGIRVMGRATQGVRLINLKKGDEIAAVAKVPHSDEEEEENGSEEENGTENATDSEE
jgi:DNA gyrase subunit A